MGSIATTRARMPSISLIVARSYPGNVIGYQNKLPWHLGSDLKKFREITTGHVVIMGMRTHESIGRALPRRTNLVMTRESHKSNVSEINLDAETQLIFSNTYEETLFIADVVSICQGRKDIFVIGGQTMYELFKEYVNKVYLTEVFAEVKGDAFFNERFDAPVWRTLEEDSVPKIEGVNDYAFFFRVYERRQRKFRFNHIQKFMTDFEQSKKWIADNKVQAMSKISKYVEQNLELAI